MDVKLRSMSKKEYEVWIDVSTKQQAIDRASVSGRSWEEEYEELNKILPYLLPKGMDSENHYFYSVDTDLEENVGYIWCGVVPGLPEKTVFLMDIHLNQNQRSKGIGRKALKEAHRLMAMKGYKTIALNVLNNNFAKMLYMSLGYEVYKEEEHSTELLKKLN
jgi:ribosomal protein S18 acetylase RimI-like enzyme